MFQKEKLLVLSNFFFCHYVFKKPSAAEASESVYMRERDKWVLNDHQIELKHFGKRENYMMCNFSFLPDYFQLYFIMKLLFIVLLCLCQRIVKDVCCRVIVCGKGLNDAENFLVSTKLPIQAFSPLPTILSIPSRNPPSMTKRAISPFVTMFSTFSHRLSIQL